VCRHKLSLLALFAFGLAVRLAIGAWHPPNTGLWFYQFAPAEMMLFAAGGLSYFVGRYIYERMSETAFYIAAVACFGSLVFVILGYQLMLPIIPSTWLFSKRLWLSAPVILLSVAVACPFLFYGTKKSTIDSFLGELSYPMYVSHVAVALMMMRFIENPFRADNILYVSSVIAISTALFLFVSLPIDKVRRRFGARVPVETTQAVRPILVPA
jgi:peptidoglycan/LPS O-acetylase OafA/YrhL